MHEIREGREEEEPRSIPTVVQLRKETAETQGSDSRGKQVDGVILPGAEAVPDCHTLILADSNMIHVQPPPGCLISCKSGAGLTDVQHLISRANDEAKQAINPQKVVIHLGTNDISGLRGHVPQLMLNYSKAMKSVKDVFPQAKLGLCSIPPRKGNGAEQKSANEVARTLNSFIEAATL